MSLRFVQQLGRLGSHLKEGGLVHTLELACAYERIPCWMYHHHRTHLLHLNDPEHAVRFRLRPEYHYITAGPVHIEALAALDPGEDPRFIARLFRGFLDDGASCYAIMKDAKIIAYNWLFQDHYTVTNDHYGPRQLVLRLSPGAAMFGNGYIMPEYRLKGLFPLLIQMAVFDRPPTTRFFTTIARLNANSLKAHERMGFATLGTIACHRVLTTPYFWSWQSEAGARLLGFGQPEVPLSALTA